MLYEPGWMWNPEKCWCDQHFIEWVLNRGAEFNIFHMGTGMHHKVGIKLGLAQVGCIVGLTYIPEEYRAYIDLAEQYPPIATNYQVLFGSVSLVNLSCFGKFDLITLFHLGESIITEPNPNNNNVVIEMLDHLKPKGYILGYRDSAATQASSRLFLEHMKLVDKYKSLDLYQLS